MATFGKYKFLWTQDLQVRQRAGLAGVVDGSCVRAGTAAGQARSAGLAHATSCRAWRPHHLPTHAPPQATYDAFMRTKPTLEAFEAELRKYNTLEQEIGAIPTVHNIGAHHQECNAGLGGGRKRAALGTLLQTAGMQLGVREQHEVRLQHTCPASHRTSSQARCRWRRRR